MCDDRNIDPIDPTHALIMFILNIILAPLGTLIYACISPQTGRNLIIGLLQLILMPFLVGWIWSIYYGYRIYRVSLNSALVSKGGFMSGGHA
jgi:hypothetical protein